MALLNAAHGILSIKAVTDVPDTHLMKFHVG
jgi:hypothetical protein